jgi:hypothetical protein
MADILLAPDVFVNASVALGSPPEHVVRRVLGGGKKVKSSEWILARVEAMLGSLDAFKKEALATQMATIRGLVEIVETKKQFGPDAWADALVATAKAAGLKRVVTSPTRPNATAWSSSRATRGSWRSPRLLLRRRRSEP